MNRKKAPGTSFSPTETNKYSTEIRLSPSLCLLPPPHAHKREEKKTDPQQGGKKRKKTPDDEQTLLFFFFFFFFTLTLLSHKTDGHKRVVAR
jgi:hypothetical protein